MFLKSLIENGRYNGTAVIVTNNHVVNVLISGSLEINHFDKNRIPDYNDSVTINFKGSEWIHHQNSYAVDLSILPLKPKFEQQIFKIHFFLQISF